MRVDEIVLLGVVLLSVGIAVGVRLRSRRVGSWAVGGTAAVFAVGSVLALWVLAVSDPFQQGGTTPHYHGDQVLGVPLAIVQFVSGLSLVYFGQLPLGLAIGTAFVFRRERYGRLRLWLAFLTVPVVFYGALWVTILR
jgi:hypothetical protein